jgi:hypothetical protein
MRTTSSLRVALLLTAVFAASCAPRPEPPPPAGPDAGAGPPAVEQLWVDFCHYVVIASPDLAAAYGRRLLDTASGGQLRELMDGDDPTTRRAVRLLDESALTAGHPDLGEVWAGLCERARSGGDAVP